MGKSIDCAKIEIINYFEMVFGRRLVNNSREKKDYSDNLYKYFVFTSKKAIKICPIFSWFWHLLSKRQNHKADCANFCGLLRKAELYQLISFRYFLMMNYLYFHTIRLVRKLKKNLEKQVSLRIDFNPLLMCWLGLIFCSVISRLSG